MSLDAAQIQRTREELAESLRRSGRDRAWLAAVSGLDVRDVAAVLEMHDAAPADVWLVADLLREAIRAAGSDPVEFSALTEHSRRDAERWFGIRTPDQVRAMLANAPSPASP